LMEGLTPEEADRLLDGIDIGEEDGEKIDKDTIKLKVLENIKGNKEKNKTLVSKILTYKKTLLAASVALAIIGLTPMINHVIADMKKGLYFLPGSNIKVESSSEEIYALEKPIVKQIKDFDVIIKGIVETDNKIQVYLCAQSVESISKEKEMKAREEFMENDKLIVLKDKEGNVLKKDRRSGERGGGGEFWIANTVFLNPTGIKEFDLYVMDEKIGKVELKKVFAQNTDNLAGNVSEDKGVKVIINSYELKGNTYFNIVTSADNQQNMRYNPSNSDDTSSIEVVDRNGKVLSISSSCQLGYGIMDKGEKPYKVTIKNLDMNYKMNGEEIELPLPKDGAPIAGNKKIIIKGSTRDFLMNITSIQKTPEGAYIKLDQDQNNSMKIMWLGNYAFPSDTQLRDIKVYKNEFPSGFAKSGVLKFKVQEITAGLKGNWTGEIK